MKMLKQSILVLMVVAVVLTVGLILWGNDVSQPTDVALQALESDAEVTVTEHDGFITFVPTGEQPSVGFVFYPGGRVDYRAYSPVLREIAAHGNFVAVVKVRINLAFFDVNAADRVISQYPIIQNWAVGGHSLGGVAASSYADEHLEDLDGLVLWASYPADDSLTNATIDVISIYGTKDIAGMEPFEKSRTQLPADTKFVVIEGGNHAQFGAYGFQSGDNPADISEEEQWVLIAGETIEFLENLATK